MSSKRKRLVGSKSDEVVKEEMAAPVPSTSEGLGAQSGLAVRKSGRQRTKSVRAPPEFTLSGITSPSPIEIVPLVDLVNEGDDTGSNRSSLKAQCIVSLKNINSTFGNIKQENVQEDQGNLSTPPPSKKTRSASGSAETTPSSLNLGGRVLTYSMREISTTFDKSAAKEPTSTAASSHINTRRKSGALPISKADSVSAKSGVKAAVSVAPNASVKKQQATSVVQSPSQGTSRAGTSVVKSSISVKSPTEASKNIVSPPGKVKRIYMTLETSDSLVKQISPGSSDKSGVKSNASTELHKTVKTAEQSSSDIPVVTDEVEISTTSVATMPTTTSEPVPEAEPDLADQIPVRTVSSIDVVPVPGEVEEGTTTLEQPSVANESDPQADLLQSAIVEEECEIPAEILELSTSNGDISEQEHEPAPPSVSTAEHGLEIEPSDVHATKQSFELEPSSVNSSKQSMAPEPPGVMSEEDPADVLTEELRRNSDEHSKDLFSMSGVVLSEDTLDCMARAEIDDDFLARLVSVTGVKPVLSDSHTILLGSWEQLVDARIIIEKLVKKQGKLKQSDRHWTDNLPKIHAGSKSGPSPAKPETPGVTAHVIKKEKDAVDDADVQITDAVPPPADAPPKKKQLMIKGSVRPETGNVKWIQMKQKPDGSEGWVEIPEGEVVKMLGLNATRDAVTKLKAQAGIGKPKDKIKVQSKPKFQDNWDGEITTVPPLAPRVPEPETPAATTEDTTATDKGEDEADAEDPDLPPVSELALESLELVNCASGVTEDKEGHIYDEEGNILMGSIPSRQQTAYVPASQKMNMKPGRALCTLNPTRADNECDVCGFRSSFEGVRKHKRRHHPKVTYACKLCGKRYAIINDMRRHWRNHRGMAPITLPEMRESMHCELCGFKGNEMDLRDHIGSEHSGSEILCALCNQVFMSKPEMEQHVQREHVKKKQKADASAAARAVREATTGLLYLSAGIKTGRKPRPGGAKFKCIWCGSRFSQESSLRYHLKIRHINVKQYACDICGKIYVDERILKTHMKRLHLGEKRHFCDVCHRGFFERRQMEDHRKTHINEDTKRRFVCSFCGCEFFKQAHLKSHEKIHLTGGQSHCDICNRAYFHDNEVHRHRPPEGPVKCTFCGREYRYKRSLHFHLRKNHNVDPTDHMMICAAQHQPADLQLAKIDGTGENEVTVSTTALDNKLTVAGDIGTIEYQIEDLEVNNAVGSLERNGEDEDGDNVVVYMCEMCHMLFTDMDELNAHFAKDHENIEETEEVVPPPEVTPSLVDDAIVPASSDLLTSVAGVDSDIGGVTIKSEMDIGTGIEGIEEMEIDDEQEVQYVILQNPDEHVAADSTIVQYQIELPQ